MPKIVTLVAAPGTPLGDQLLAVFQVALLVPTQDD